MTRRKGFPSERILTAAVPLQPSGEAIAICRFYSVIFACFCEHDLKIIKRCACSLERYTGSLCDIFQPGKEPILLKDLCAICAFLGRADNANPERVYERYYELQDLEGLETLELQVGGGEDDEMAVVLGADVWETMMRLVDALPVIEAAKPEKVADEWVGEEDDKENFPPKAAVSTGDAHEEAASVGFLMTLVDRTKRLYNGSIDQHYLIGRQEMCKWYSTRFACLCEHDLKVVKPCACCAEREAQDYSGRLCDILQGAKEPIILKDHCTVCAKVQQRALFGQQGMPPQCHGIGGRYYESSDVQGMPTVPVFSRWNGHEKFAVLEPEAFDSMFKLMETLPNLEGEVVQQAVEVAEEVADKEEQRVATGEHGVPGPTFSMEVVDRTKR
ncbi:hypothetical protein LTR85_001047 [Meristemomyces frigidus]|nr:hypothetical protein LTR85_001047 [Meristemomyces frigidus]